MAGGFCLSYSNSMVGVSFGWYCSFRYSAFDSKLAGNQSGYCKPCKKFENRINSINHDKKLFQNRMAQSWQKQRLFVNKYFRVGNWYGLQLADLSFCKRRIKL